MLKLKQKNYINVTDEWLNNSDTSYKEIVFAKEVKKTKKYTKSTMLIVLFWRIEKKKMVNGLLIYSVEIRIFAKY